MGLDEEDDLWYDIGALCSSTRKVLDKKVSLLDVETYFSLIASSLGTFSRNKEPL